MCPLLKGKPGKKKNYGLSRWSDLASANKSLWRPELKSRVWKNDENETTENKVGSNKLSVQTTVSFSQI